MVSHPALSKAVTNSQDGTLKQKIVSMSPFQHFQNKQCTKMSYNEDKFRMFLNIF